MSDQQDKNSEPVAQDAAAAAETMQVSAATNEAAGASQPARGGSSAPGWIAILLVLGVAAALGWLIMEQRRADAGIGARLQALEATTGRDAGSLDELDQRWQGQLKTAVQQMQGDSGALNTQLGQVSQSLEDLQAQLEEQRAELARYNANDRDDWLLAEAQYLLRLANQRLIMSGDTVAAQTLLGNADRILMALDDVRLHEARAAVATDLAALRAVPRVDVEGVYLRLGALVVQADKLVIFELPEQESRPVPAPADNWQARLQQGYEGALAKLSDYVIIRRRDVPMRALMDPQWEGLVRQNLRMLLEQAQVALLSGNQVLFRESLERAQHWVAEFFDSDEAAARAMSREISQLEQTPIASKLPDISNSSQALDAVVKQRLQPGGAE